MLPLLTEKNFRGDINIPNTDATADGQVLCRFITDYTPQFLDYALGIDLASAFNSALAAASDTVAIVAPYDFLLNGGTYTDLAGRSNRWEGLQYAAARYVYWHYMRDLSETTTASGVRVTSNENSVNVRPVYKQVTAWNQMCQSVARLWYMLGNYNTGGTLVFTYIPVRSNYMQFRLQNVFGI